MRSCVKTSVPASAVSSSVSGSFYAPNSKDIVTASANTLTLATWCTETESMRLRFETTLPGRILALEKLVIGNEQQQQDSASSFSGSSSGPTNLLVALYSESLLGVMRWSSNEHIFKNVALFALSVEEIDGAVPIVEGISSERSIGLPPILRVDQNRSMILVLAQRRYAHSISMIYQKSGLHHQSDNNNNEDKAVDQDAAAKSEANKSKNTTAGGGKKKKGAASKKKQAVAWADDEDNSDDDATKNDPEAVTATTAASNSASTTTTAPSFFNEETFYENHISFSTPKTFDLLTHVKSAKNIRDIHFVQGFSEPTIAILREGSATWAGRVRLMTSGSSVVRALSCGVVIANIDDVSEKITVVRELDGLPYSATQLCPLPASTMSSLGGVLCFSAHSVCHVTFRGTAYAAIVNNLGRDESSADQSGNIRWGDMEFTSSATTSSSSKDTSTMTQQEKIQAKRAMLAATRSGHLKTFADIAVTSISENSVFISHGQDGSCDILDLTSVDNKTVSSIKCTSLSSSAVVGSASTLNVFSSSSSISTSSSSSSSSSSSQLIFFGSRVHDSFLLQYEQQQASAAAVASSASSKQHKISVVPNGLLYKSLSAAVDLDIVDYDSTDPALTAEMSRFAAERARAEDKDNKNSQDSLNPYKDLITTEAPVLRAPPKPLSHRIKSSAVLVASGSLPQHSYISALRQHASLEVVHRQNMDCSAIFSLSSLNPETSSLSLPDGKRARGGVAAVTTNNTTTSSYKRRVHPETVALLFGASSTTAVVGTFGGKLTQIQSQDAGFAVSERTIAAFELGNLNNKDIFVQLTTKSVIIVSYDASATQVSSKFSRLDTIMLPHESVHSDQFRQAVAFDTHQCLVLTDFGSIFLVSVSHSKENGFCIDFNPEQNLAKSILGGGGQNSSSSAADNHNKISFISSLSIGNRQSCQQQHLQKNSRESSLIACATTQGHLIIVDGKSLVSSSSSSLSFQTVTIENFFTTYPSSQQGTLSSSSTNHIDKQDAATTTSDANKKSSCSLSIDDMLLCRLHGNSDGVPDDNLTLVVRRASGEVTCFGLDLVFTNVNNNNNNNNNVNTNTIISIWRKASLLHDIDRGNSSNNAAGDAFETIAEKKRKKELLEKQQQEGSTSTTNDENKNNNTSNKQSSPSSKNLPLGCARLCYLSNVGTNNNSNSETDAVYICGATLSQLIVSDRGLLRNHSVRCPNGSGDGVKSFVRCAAAINCKALANGIVLCEVASTVLGRFYSSSSSSSSSSSASTSSSAESFFDLRCTWPTRRVPLQGTPEFLVYNSSNICAVAITSTHLPYRPTKAPYDKALKGGNDNSENSNNNNIISQIVNSIEHETISETEGTPIPMQKRFKMQLFCAGVNWIPGGSFDFLENEIVLCCMNGLINLSKSNAMRPKLQVESSAAEYIVIGTSFPQGDDVACRGRILVFGVSLHSGKRHLHAVHVENMKAPVSALTCIGGCIVAAVGSSIRIYALDPTGSSTGKSALATCGFLSNSTYITSLTSMKNFLIVGDIFQSVSLVSLRAAFETGSSSSSSGGHHQGGGHHHHGHNSNSASSLDSGTERIVLLAQDRFQREITATGFLSSGQEAVLLGADSRDNLLVLHYEPPRTAVMMVEQKRRQQELIQQQQVDMNNSTTEEGLDNKENDNYNNNMNQHQKAATPGVDIVDAAAASSSSAVKNIRGGIIDVTTLQLIQSFKLSGPVSKMLRIRSPNPSTLNSFTGDNCSMYLTSDGEVGFVLPLTEKESRILRWATTQHTAEAESVGGLHVEMERSGRLNDMVRLQGAPAVDFHHIQKVFVSESDEKLRKTVARKAGSTIDKMMSMFAKIQDSYIETMF